jgi:hypothetical protein
MDSNVSTMAQKPVQSQTMQVGTAKRPEIIVSNTEQPRENHKVLRDEATFDLPNVSGKVRYDDLFGAGEGVSVVYTTYRNKIEEDIYIEKPTDITSFSMEVEASDLIPRLNTDNSVDFLDNDGKMCYHVGIPYMMDADFAVLYDIETTVSRSDDTWVITYTPDVAWFTSEERAYPILLDPSITTNDYVSNIEDTYVEENSTTNHIDEQYLYITANGNNKRNAVVRITKLPVIDEAMPIISAKLTLTAQYAPFSDVALKAGYYDSGLELDEYDYSLTTGDFFTYTAYSYLSVGLTTVTFDVSSHIYEMYDDEEYDKKHGYDYHGDFIIGYATSGDTTFAYPFFSSDYASPASRPVFTVKYGYTLPAGILNGEVFSFQNCGSYSYMTVNGTAPANNSNIYQVWNDEDIATTTQKFKLEYVASTGGYLLRSMCSSSGSDKVVSIERGTDELYSGGNVRLYSAIDSISQEWLIIPVDYDIFRIVPRANMSLTLTAYGYDNGTNTDRSSTSEGNIFVQTLSDNDHWFQQWFIYDDDDNVISTQQFRSTFETGNYYLSNNYTGRYLHRTSNVANCMSGKISSLGDETVKWQIVNLGDGYCTIQRSDIPHYYLAPTSNSSGSGVKVYSNLSETIPDDCKWYIKKDPYSNGKYLIQSKTSGYYLYALDQSANPSSICLYPLYQKDTVGYSKQTWRIANEDNYVELGYGVTFNDITIDIDETQHASISTNGAYWSSYTDFDYTIDSGSQYVSYNVSTKKFTGVTPGTAAITATHKVTGISRSFSITVSYISVVIPCTFARVASDEDIKSFAISISPYLAEYSSYLNGVTWYEHGNGAAIFDLQNMTVKGVSQGFAWLEARKNGETVLVCFVYVEDILKYYPQDVQEYLYMDGSWLGQFSLLKYADNPSVDPFILRTEWFLYAVQLMIQGQSSNEIKAELIRKFGLNIPEDNLFRPFISEVEMGAAGNYSRDNLKLSFDGVRDLFNFFWLQYAAYCVATIDTVNIYTPATMQDVIEEQRVARKMCRDARDIIQQAKDRQFFSNYNVDDFQPQLLKKGTIICGMRAGQTEWYTTPECALASEYNVKTLYNKLQVSYNPNYGYRTTMGYYEVLEDTYVAYGKALNNTTHGVGGYNQYFVPNYSDVLKLLYEIPLNE